ncbi:DNA-binding protein HEXBP, partial [Exaiptasia diaphana]|uniref:CCHC-type domain-containing protein n=1 Tax=Exaiptasia diaphana TaxID=2652724 RepID=A0A913YK91_EXADI
MAYRHPSSEPNVPRYYRRRKCYVCGGRGHTAHRCPSPDNINIRDASTCNNCGGRGHASLACPTPSNRGNKEERMAALLNNLDEVKNRHIINNYIF